MNTRPRSSFRHLRLSPRLTLAVPKGRRVVVLAPHPDDETLGCGLLIARLVRTGVPVAVVALTDGDASHPGSLRWPPQALAQTRRRELRRALQRLGAGRAAVRFMGWPDGALDRALGARRLAAACRVAGAGAILAASGEDHHPDHRAGFAAAGVAARWLGIPLVGYAVWSRLGTAPLRRVRDPATAAKRWAVAAHRSQVSDYIGDAPAGFRLAGDTIRRFVGEAERFAPAIIRTTIRQGGSRNRTSRTALSNLPSV